MKTVIRWIPVARQLPTPHLPCLVVASGHIIVTELLRWSGYQWLSANPDDVRVCRQDITHWCPIFGLEVE